MATPARFLPPIFFVAVFGGVVAHGATITVFSNADSGAGTLRQAIFDASPGDTIKFAVSNGQVINVTSGELLINKNLTIQGPGANKLILQGSVGVTARVFRIAPSSVTATIAGVKIQNGRSVNADGGAILNLGTLTVEGCQLAANSTEGSGNGAAIANSGMLKISNSTLENNRAREGAPFYGGGVYNTGSVAIVNSTISDNGTFYRDAAVYGGGIANVNGGTMTIMNSTVAGNGTNGSAGCGGGIYTVGGASSSVHSTITALNIASSSPDICGPVISQNFNLIGNNSGATISNQGSSDQIGTSTAPIDPLLGPLQYNGGPTFTRALQSNSTAVDSGDPNSPARDQRGYTRAGVSDIGAFEFHGTVPVSLANISTRLPVETGDNVLIGGFIITGAQPKKIILRALGPSLPVPNVLANPILELRNSSGGLIAINDNWRSDQEGEIIATTIPPPSDLESAIVATVPANNSAYTAIMRGVNGGTGTGVVEVYDLNRTVDSKLGNISTRGLVQTGDNVLIGGLIVFGEDPVKVIVRAIGPSLSLPGKLADPTLGLHDGNGTLLMENDNWRSAQEAEVIATTIPPSHDRESAIVRMLTPGNYTAIVRGVNNTTGIGVVEAYGLN